jgi:hypothetical protein
METQQKLMMIDTDKIERDLMRNISMSSKLDSSDDSHDRRHRSESNDADSIDNDILGLPKKKGVKFNIDEDGDG